MTGELLTTGRILRNSTIHNGLPNIISVVALLPGELSQRRNPDSPQSQIQIRRIRLAHLHPRSEYDVSWKLSYGLTKVSDNGGGGPVIKNGRADDDEWDG